ncbi:MAG: MFS transporter [Deinococcota bacterium]
MRKRLTTLPPRVTPVQRAGLLYFLFWGSAGVYAPFLSVHLANLGVSSRGIGLLMALIPLMTLITSPLASFWADRRGHHTRLLTWLLMASIPSLLLLIWAQTFVGLAIGIALFASCRGPAEPLTDNVVVTMSKRHGFQYGRARLWGSLSFAVIALAGGALWGVWGYASMFAVAALFTLPIAALTSQLPQETIVRQGVRLSKVIRDPIVITLTLTSILVSGALDMHETFAGVYMSQLGGSALAVGAIWAISAFCELPTMHYASALMTRWSGLTALMLSYVLLGLTHVGYALLETPAQLLSLSIVKGLGYGLFFIATVHTVHVRTPPEWSATALSVVLGVATLGIARLVGAGLSGFLYDLSPQLLYNICAGVTLVAIVILLVLKQVTTPHAPVPVTAEDGA